MIRSAWLLAFVLVAVAGPSFATPPPIGDEVVLDHGFRYQDAPMERSLRCAITTADSLVLLAYGDVDRIRLYRRGASGTEIDVNSQVIGSMDRAAGPFDLSPFDSISWKVAYLSDDHGPGDWRSLWVRSLDPRTLSPVTQDLMIQASESGAIRTPCIAWNGTRHLVAWVEAPNRMVMVRLRPDMAVEDPEPVVLADSVAWAAAAVCARPGGGLAAWIGADRGLCVDLLDEEGLPRGTPRTIDAWSSSGAQLVDICSSGTDWFVAWTNPAGVSFALLDSTGAVLYPGIHRVAGADADQGLAVAAGGPAYVVAWRTGYGGDSAVRAVRYPGGWVLETIASLEGSYVADDWPEQPERRNLDVSWTGAGFVLLWNTWSYPPVARAPGSQSPADRSFPGWPDSWPVYARWLSAEGDPLTTEPVMQSVGSRPDLIGTHYADGCFITVTSDEVSRLYLHTQPIGDGGAPLTAATRFRTAVGEPDCDWFNCDRSWMHGMAVRSAGTEALALYGFHNSVDSHVGTWIEDTDVILDRVSGGGGFIARYTIHVDQETTWGTMADGICTFDVARGPDSYLVAYEASESQTSHYIRVVKLDLQGRETRRWSIEASGSAAEPTIAACGSRAMIFWLEQSPAASLRRAVIDPADPSSAVVGEPIVGVTGTQGAPYLVPGPAQLLALFPSQQEGAADFDIYAQRYDLEGAPLDPLPIPIRPAPGNQGYVSGVWDSNQYLVAWSNSDAGSEAIYGARFGANGVVCDSSAFLIREGIKSAVSLAADEYGHVIAAYGGNRVRQIDDLVPVLDPDSGWPSDPTGSDGQIALRIGQAVPNPGRGRVHLDLDLPLGSTATVQVMDLAGRLVRSCLVGAVSTANGWTWDGCREDGEQAPAGIYLFRISTGDRAVARKAVLLR